MHKKAWLVGQIVIAVKSCAVPPDDFTDSLEFRSL